MTAEVIVMNKYGIAMAADTALTVATPQGPKLYDNISKLFHLSDNAPVAIMVYGSVEFGHVPWEVLINDYRERLGPRVFGNIDGYANDFLTYLNGITTDEDDERETVLSTVFGHFSELTRSAKEHMRQDGPGVDTAAAANQHKLADFLSSVAAAMERRPTIRRIDNGCHGFVRKFRREIFTARKHSVGETFSALLTGESLRILWRLAYLYTIKDVFSPSSSGVVVAGFGSRQLLPSVRGYAIDGPIRGTIKCKLTTKRDVTKHNEAMVIPFAQTEMIQRFMRGVDSAYDNFVEDMFDKEITKVATYVSSRGHSRLGKKEFERILQEEMELIRRETANYRQERYINPIIHSVKNVPKSELAVLAEALVEITSLKRRMSTDIETVGGPIDVAVLSKTDGLIWIRDAHAREIGMRAGRGLDEVDRPANLPGSNQRPVRPARSARRGQVATILAVDVHGEGGLVGGSGEQVYQRTSHAIQLIRSLIGDYGGAVQRFGGNGILALFDSATRALQFAVAIQAEFRNDAAWRADEEAIAVRIGIDVGEVWLSADEMQGHSVDVATWAQGLVQPGGICITEAVRGAVRDTRGITMRRLRAQAPKNITETVEVFAIDTTGPTPVGTGPPREGRIIPPPPRASIAVLPLDNVSGDPRDSHLCDGFTGDIITNLSRFRDLLVIARHSAFLFRDRDVPSMRIAGQLGVRYLLTGGLQRSGRKLRLRTQLTEADTDCVIWSDRYDGDLRDLFAFQDDVAAIIAARLAVQITAAEQRRLVSEHPPDLQAYGLVLRGQDLGLQFRKEANLHARRLFEQAAEIDPDYGRCYAGLSRTFNLAWRYRWARSPDAALDRAVELAHAAIGHDSLDARGYGELGFAQLYKKYHDESLAAYHRAVELNPNDADLLAEMADAMTYCGQTTKAVDLLKQAMRLNPYYPDWYLWYLGEAYFYGGDYQQAIQTLQQMRDQSEAHRLLASSYAHLGVMNAAAHHAREVLRVHPNFSLEHWRNVPPNKDSRENERFLEGLRKAGLR
jgi:adenylate cyclase